MSRRIGGGALVVLVCVAAACARTPRPLSNPHAAAMRDSVEDALTRFRHYSATRQWDSLMTMYADDPRFRWVENGVVRYRSPAQVRAGLASLPPNARIESTYQNSEIIPIQPGVAQIVTQFQTRIVFSEASTFEFGGAITMTMIHQADGWRILGGHTSSPIPRPR